MSNRRTTAGKPFDVVLRTAQQAASCSGFPVDRTKLVYDGQPLHDADGEVALKEGSTLLVASAPVVRNEERRLRQPRRRAFHAQQACLLLIRASVAPRRAG